jgi:phytoene dehydrogenase-like protein
MGMPQQPIPAEADVVFVGAGHNAMVCAAYLARAGLRVLLLESQPQVGGGVTTAEVTLPLFKHNLHAFFVRLTSSFRIWRDLNLTKYGLETIFPEVQNAVPLQGGGGLVSYRSLERSIAEIKRFDASDAEQYSLRFEEYREIVEHVIEPMRLAPPLPPDEEQDLLRRSALGRRYLELTAQSAIDLCMNDFQNEHLRALLLFNVALRGYLPVMDVPGTGYVYLMALTNSHNGGCVRGGSFEAAKALAACVYDSGGLLATNARVERVIVQNGRAAGVELADGQTIHARRAVVSNLTAEHTLIHLVGTAHLPQAVAEAASNYRWNDEALFGVHLALREPPRYRGSDTLPALDQSLNYAVGYETSADLVTHMHEIRAQKMPARPGFHAGVPTLHDPSQAPPGYHTAFAWQFVPSQPADGGKERWKEHAESYADEIMAQWHSYAPNLAEAGVARYVHSPLHTEWHVPSMFYGDRHHGSYHPENFGYYRPHPTLSGYRMPLDGLYLCGAGTHPGGSFTGYPGYNAAGVIARDLGLDPWWKPSDVRAALAGLA